MSVLFKFKSANDYDIAPIVGFQVSLFDLKRLIVEHKKLKRGLDFDLSISNAETKEAYTDSSFIPKNARVVVKRVPAPRSGGLLAKIREQEQSLAASVVPDVSQSTSTTSTTFQKENVAGGSEDGTGDEDAQIKAVNASSEALRGRGIGRGHGWQSGQGTLQHGHVAPPGTGMGMGGRGIGAARIGVRSPSETVSGRNASSGRGYLAGRGSVGTGVPPESYICYRCNQRGHFINNCPTNDNYDNVKIRRNTGIPKSMVTAVSDVNSLDLRDGTRVLVTTADGGLGVVEPQWADFKKLRQSKGGLMAGAEEVATRDVPPGLACALCKGLIRDALLLPCCQHSVCDRCIRPALQSLDFCCPLCNTPDMAIDKLMVNRSLRTSVLDHRKRLRARAEEEAERLKAAESALKAKLEDEMRTEREYSEGLVGAKGSKGVDAVLQIQTDRDLEDDFGGDIYALSDDEGGAEGEGGWKRSEEPEDTAGSPASIPVSNSAAALPPAVTDHCTILRPLSIMEPQEQQQALSSMLHPQARVDAVGRGIGAGPSRDGRGSNWHIDVQMGDCGDDDPPPGVEVDVLHDEDVPPGVGARPGCLAQSRGSRRGPGEDVSGRRCFRCGDPGHRMKHCMQDQLVNLPAGTFMNGPHDAARRVRVGFGRGIEADLRHGENYTRGLGRNDDEIWGGCGGAMGGYNYGGEYEWEMSCARERRRELRDYVNDQPWTEERVSPLRGWEGGVGREIDKGGRGGGGGDSRSRSCSRRGHRRGDSLKRKVGAVTSLEREKGRKRGGPEGGEGSSGEPGGTGQYETRSHAAEEKENQTTGGCWLENVEVVVEGVEIKNLEKQHNNGKTRGFVGVEGVDSQTSGCKEPMRSSRSDGDGGDNRGVNRNTMGEGSTGGPLDKKRGVSTKCSNRWKRSRSTSRLESHGRKHSISSGTRSRGKQQMSRERNGSRSGGKRKRTASERSDNTSRKVEGKGGRRHGDSTFLLPDYQRRNNAAVLSSAEPGPSKIAWSVADRTHSSSVVANGIGRIVSVVDMSSSTTETTLRR